MPVADAPDREPSRSPGPIALIRRRPYASMVAASLLIGALSLLFPSTASYDPWSWLTWGREIVHFKLQTTGGPTWKPLPAMFTTVFALFGHASPDLWLMVARAGAFCAAVMVCRVSYRLTAAIGGLTDQAPRGGATGWLMARGPALLAGAIAGVCLVFSGGYISDNTLGYSEGLMTALVLVAVERHLDGHPRQAFVVGFFAALDRPELWLFWGPYGLWLFWRDAGARKLVIGLFALIPILWFGPEYWGSGHFLRGVSRAHNPRSNSPAFKPCPFCSLLVDHAWPTVLLRIKILAALLVAGTLYVLGGAARRGRPASADSTVAPGGAAGGAAGGVAGRQLRTPAWLPAPVAALAPRTPRDLALLTASGAALLGLVWFVLIAVLTQAGFSGNDRYLVLGSALIDIGGGVGWGCVAILLARYGPALVRRAGMSVPRGAIGAVALGLALAGFVALPNFVGNNLISLQRTHRSLIYQANLRRDVAHIVRHFGGPARVLACGTVMTEGFQVPLVAWYLGTHSATVEAPPTGKIAGPPWPNVILQTRDTHHASLLPLWTTIHHWESLGARYRVRNFKTIRVFFDCRK